MGPFHIFADRTQAGRQLGRALSQPDFFGAVGSHYADFHQVSDDEVIAGLARISREILCAQPERAAAQGDSHERTR